jgi:S1-C subfamily serine protease
VGLPLTLQPDPYLPTDTTPFYVKGVPVLNLFTGAHEDYSSPRDTPDRLDYDGVRDVARLAAGLVRSVARAPRAPGHVEVERRQSGLARKHLRAYLGTIPAYGQDESVQGVQLQGAVKGGPADEAGVVGGDVVVELAGVEVRTIHDYMGALSGLKVGEETDLVVLRDGKPERLRVVPGARE